MLLVSNRNIKLLIVENYKLALKGLECIFEQDEQVRIIGTAESAEDGLNLMRREIPDVALVDLDLPGMDGIEMTKRIKAVYPSLKVIIFTTDETEERVLGAFSAGANAYCIKGEEPRKMLDIVKSVFQGALWFDPNIASIALRFFTGRSYRHAEQLALNHA